MTNSSPNPVTAANSPRRGAVTVEFAIVCSLLFLTVFAGLEFARANMIRNSIEAAAYEGARCGIVPGATNAECVSAAQAYLVATGVPSANVTATPTNLNGAAEVTVNVSIALNGSNMYTMPTFFAGKTLSTSITLPREDPSS